MRFAYVKNGDAVDQVSRLMTRLNNVPTSGPDAFIADFLRRYSTNTLLILSRGGANRLYRTGDVEARMFFRDGRNITKPITRVWVSIKMFLHLLRFRPERILCGTTGSALWVSYFVSKIFSVPLVHSRHNRVSDDGNGLLKRLHVSIDNWIINRVKSVICHGPFLRRQIIDIGVPEEKVLEFDVRFDPSLYDVSARLPNIAGLSDSDQILLYVGRIEENKGVFDLLRACREYLEQNKRLKLMYIGDGNALDNLRAEVRDAELGDKVILAGRMDHHELLAMIARSFVMVCPTQSRFPEGRCMAAMEGLVMEIPVIAPDFGPFPYLVKHGENGILFQPDSLQELKQAIGSMLADNKLYTKLKQGARESGQIIRDPELTFAQAVEKAFDVSETEREGYVSKA